MKECVLQEEQQGEISVQKHGSNESPSTGGKQKKKNKKRK